MFVDPRQDAVERIENGDDPAPVLTGMSKADLLAIIAAATDGFVELDFDPNEVEGTIVVTRDHLRGLARWAATKNGGGD